MSADQYTPTMIAQQALDACAIDFMLGDINEGTDVARRCLRWYGECVRQMLRGAHWDFARKEATLQLVGDRTNTTEGAQNLVPSGFLYSYSYPADCAKVRFIPANYYASAVAVPSDNIVPADSDSPIMSGLVSTFPMGLTPTRFLITGDTNYIPDGASNDTPGVSPVSQTLILSNQRNAKCVYTMQAMYPNLWDSLFRNAVVAYLASRLVLSVHKDKKFATQLQNNLILQAQAALNEARRTNGNETWASSDLQVDWMRARLSGGGYWGVSPYGMAGYGGMNSIGVLFGAYESVMFGNSSAF